MLLTDELKNKILKEFEGKKIAVLHGGISDEREVF